MGENELLPLKRFELSLSKFNEVAIPHHLELLKQHKANIIKCEAAGQYARVVSEQRHSARVVSQLRALLRDVARVRQRVATNERARFDALTHRAREDTLNAIVDFLEWSPLAVNRASGEVVSASGGSADSVGLVPEHELLQHQCALQESELESVRKAREGWSEVEREVVGLHGAWAHLQQLAAEQRPLVAAADTSIAVASHNVAAGRLHLAAADRSVAGAWGAWGAWGAAGLAGGALCAGPLGALAGAKAALAAAAAGSLLGYFGGSALDRRRRRELTAEADKPVVDADKQKTDTGTTDTSRTDAEDKKAQ